MKPSEKQVNMLVYQFRNHPSISIQKIWNQIPTHNKQYTNKKANYQSAIFEDWLLARATSKQVSYLIKLMMNGRSNSVWKIKSILRQINNQKNNN